MYWLLVFFSIDFFFFFSSRRRHTRWNCDWSSDVCSSDLHALHALPRMIRGEVHLAGGGIEAEDAQGGDHRGRAAAAETDALAPARAIAEAGRGDEVDPLAEAVLLLRHDHHEAAREARDVPAAPAAGQAHLRLPPVADVGGVEVAEAIDLGAPDEAQVDQALLEQRHDLEGAGAPERPQDVGGVAHREQRLRRGLVAHDAVLEEPGRPRRVGALGVGEGDQRQAHADEDQIVVADLPRGGDDHELALGEIHAARYRSTKGWAAFLTKGWRRRASSLISTPRPGPEGSSSQPSRAWMGRVRNGVSWSPVGNSTGSGPPNVAATCRVAASPGPK